MSVSTEYLNNIESELQRSLRPVRPNPEFVHRLQSRLVSPATTLVERPSNNLALVVFGFGLLVGLFVLWLIRQLR
jgi:hypothetical protein